MDGPSGAGKSTLAGEVAHQAVQSGRSAAVIHLDHLLDGWGGLKDVPDVLERQVLRHLADDRVLQHRRYDWRAGHFTTPVVVPVTDLLLVEGVGAGARRLTGHGDLLVWVEAEPQVRRARALERDGNSFTPWIDAWTEAEQAHHAREATRERADLVLRT